MIDQYKLFLDLHRLFAENNIRYWFICGTLLGAIRERKFIGHDPDVDIACSYEDYWRVREIIDRSPDWKYYRVWNKELALWHGERKLDVFFMDRDETNTYIYSYKLNSFTGKWDTEWRSYFPVKDYYPLKQVSFLGQKILVPNNPEAILTTHYGADWKIPKPAWSVKEMTNVDKNHRQIGILIKETSEENYARCVESIRKFLPEEWIRVYRFPKANVENIKEPFILFIDDTFVFSKEININVLLQVLLDKEENLAVGGKLTSIDERRNYFINTFQSFESKSQVPVCYEQCDFFPKFYLSKNTTLPADVEKFLYVEHINI